MKTLPYLFSKCSTDNYNNKYIHYSMNVRAKTNRTYPQPSLLKIHRTNLPFSFLESLVWKKRVFLSIHLLCCLSFQFKTVVQRSRNLHDYDASQAFIFIFRCFIFFVINWTEKISHTANFSLQIMPLFKVNYDMINVHFLSIVLFIYEIYEQKNEERGTSFVLNK